MVRPSLRLAGTLTIALCLTGTSCGSVDIETTNPPTTGSPTEVPTTTAPTTAPPTTAVPTTAVPTTAVPTTAVPTTAVPALDELPLPAEPAELAEALVEIERLVRQERSPEAGRRQQQLYRVLSANPEWGDEILADPAVAEVPAIALNWAARKDLSALVRSTDLSTTLPAWTIREPLPAEELLGYYREAEAQTGVEWTYLAAIHLVETRMGRIEGVSTAGAAGPMQFLPSTWEGCCTGDLTIDRDAIMGAATYLSLVGAPGDMPRALFSYNQSQRYVDSVSNYAAVLRAEPDAYYGYHAWQVYFLSAAGLLVMPTGYSETEPVDAAIWLADHPQYLVDTDS